MTNRASALLSRAQDCGAKPAIIFGDETITFSDLSQRVRASAGGLAALGIGRGSHVGILLPTAPDFVVVEHALLALGAVVTPLNAAFRASEVAHAVACCDLTHVVTNNALFGELGATALPAPCRSILIDGDLVAAIAASEPLVEPVPLLPGDPALLLMTSATTGKAKGVILNVGNLAANYDRTPDWLGLSDEDRILCALPLTNTFALNQCINAMAVLGATMVLLPRFDAESAIQAIERHRCTFLPAVPTMLQRIFDHPASDQGALKSLRHIMTGGAPVPKALLERILAKAPDARVLTGYGLTEATALVTLTQVALDAQGDLLHGNTIGRVLYGQDLAILDEQGQPCPPGQTGEIAIRGPNVMSGYYKSPADTAQALQNGWLHSGDIGYVDEEGFVFLVDRKKDIIIRGGQNIYPVEIEEVLYQIDGVAEAAVIGARDDDLGEVPHAYIAFALSRSLSTDEIARHCRDRLAHYKLPAAIFIRDELPKGPTGKILRRALRDASIVT